MPEVVGIVLGIYGIHLTISRSNASENYDFDDPKKVLLLGGQVWASQISVLWRIVGY